MTMTMTMTMTDKELIKNLSLLKRIEPKKEWVIFAKTRIMTQNPAEPLDFARGKPRGNLIGQLDGVGHIIDTFTFIMRKPAFAMAGFGLVIVLGLLFQFNQQRLAQDEVSNLALAQQRLEQLQKIAESASKGDFKGDFRGDLKGDFRGDFKGGVTGDIKGDLRGDLAAALKEFQETSASLSRQVAGFEAKDHAKALQAGRGIIQLQKSAADLERIYGISIGEKAQEDLQTAAKTLVENEIADLSTRTLSAEQQTLFNEAKAAFDIGDYEVALETIWEISNAR